MGTIFGRRADNEEGREICGRTYVLKKGVRMGNNRLPPSEADDFYVNANVYPFDRAGNPIEPDVKRGAIVKVDTVELIHHPPNASRYHIYGRIGDYSRAGITDLFLRAPGDKWFHVIDESAVFAPDPEFLEPI
jgi:hypothetical protein